MSVNGVSVGEAMVARRTVLQSRMSSTFAKITVADFSSNIGTMLA
jgi:hypothetical protein